MKAARMQPEDLDDMSLEEIMEEAMKNSTWLMMIVRTPKTMVHRIRIGHQIQKIT